ncbi:MAG: flippase [Deltaproteobacteria bacterium]|nr:flippase [Deltaproteobacteria bacterium]
MKTFSIAHQDERASDSSDGIHTLAKGASLSFGGEIGHVLIIYAYGIVIARFLGSSDYGIFFLGITIFNLAALLSLGGIEDGLMRFIGLYAQTGEKHQLKTLVRLSLLIAIVLGGLLGFICFLSQDLLAEKIFHKPELAIVLRYLSFAIPLFAIMTVSVASIRGLRIILPYVFVRKIFMPLVSLLLAVLVLVLGYRLQGLAVTYLLAVGASAVLAFSFLFFFISPFTGDASGLQQKGAFFSFLGSVYLSNLLLFLFSWSDLIILGIFRPSSELGIYFAAKRTAMLLTLLLISVNAILVPVISHLYSSDKRDQLEHAYKTGTQWILILGLPVLLVILFFSNEILSLFGPGFEAARTCLVVLACGQFVNLSVGSVGYLLLMTGHQKWMVFNSIFVILFNIPLVIVLVSRYGLIGAAWATGVTLILANFVALVEVYFLLRLHPYNLRYFKLLSFGILTAALAYIFKRSLPDSGSIMLVLIQAFIIFIVFFTLLLLFGLEKEEKEMLLSVREKSIPYLVKNLLGPRNG